MMSKVCAAGTGSYLEEQAEKLGISIREEFGELALASDKPVRLGERCTVFMESDLVHHQQRGAAKEDLVAGLSYSIVQNYLNKVAEDRPIGDTIFYQGATAANRGIVAAFQQVLGQAHHGAAPPRRHRGHRRGAPGQAGADLGDFPLQGLRPGPTGSTTSNLLNARAAPTPAIARWRSPGEKPLFYGGRCEKYEVSREQQAGDLPDLVREREDLLYGPVRASAKKASEAAWGIPLTMFFQELMPFFRTFSRPLGFTVVYSQKTNKQVIRQGVECLAAEPCYPVKVAHGHVLDLLQAGIKVFSSPASSICRIPTRKSSRGWSVPWRSRWPTPCPRPSILPLTVPRLLSPVLYFGRGYRALRQGMRGGGRIWGISLAVDRALLEGPGRARRCHYGKFQARGREILDSLPSGDRLMVLVGRPYNALDPGMNLNVHWKLQAAGGPGHAHGFFARGRSGGPGGNQAHVLAFRPENFDGGGADPARPPILRRLYHQFRLRPRSFIQHFFKTPDAGETLSRRSISTSSLPDVGAITRLEAFLDSLQMVTVAPAPARASRPRVTGSLRRKIYLPYMSDHILALVAAYQACGAEAEALPESDAETLVVGRRLTSGKECYPLILTTGDLAKLVQRPDFDPDHSSFFMPNASGPCRSGQYNRYQRLVLDELGYPQVPVYAPDQDVAMYEELDMVGEDFDRSPGTASWPSTFWSESSGRPAPTSAMPGETDKVYQHFLQKTYEALRDRVPLTGVLR